MRCLNEAVKLGWAIETRSKKDGWGYSTTNYTPLKDIFFVIGEDLPSRKGCVGRLITSNGYNVTLQFSDDALKPVIKTMIYRRVDMLPIGTDTELKWHFNKNTKPKIKPKTNKFGQDLEKGLLVVGAVGRRSKQNCLMFGHITRWTESTVWIEPYGNFADANWMRADVTKANNDVKLIGFSECFVIEETDDLKSQLLVQVLRG